MTLTLAWLNSPFNSKDIEKSNARRRVEKRKCLRTFTKIDEAKVAAKTRGHPYLFLYILSLFLIRLKPLERFYPLR